MEANITCKRIAATTIIIAIALSLGLFTTSEYVKARRGFHIEMGTQIIRHQAVLDGRAGSPWQYRVLSPYLIQIALGLFKQNNNPRHIATTFVIFRMFQDTIVLLLAYAYYRKWGLSVLYAIMGMAILAWGMSYAHYDSDLQFNTFFDIIFYLLAGLCILHGRFVWIVPMTLFAALNRETSGLIPFMLLSVSMVALPEGNFRKVIPIFAVAFGIYVTAFFGLRVLYGSQEFIFPHGHHPGIDLLKYNLFRTITWRQLIATLSVIPIIALIGYRKWPHQLRAFFWVIVPTWIVIHTFVAVMAETRLFLVPQAVVFIPGALSALAQGHAPNSLSAPLREAV